MSRFRPPSLATAGAANVTAVNRNTGPLEGISNAAFSPSCFFSGSNETDSVFTLPQTGFRRRQPEQPPLLQAPSRIVHR
jgi:hypothetical protein